MLHTVENTIEDIIVACFESGFSWWLDIDDTLAEWSACPEEMPYSKWASKLLNEGKSIHLVLSDQVTEEFRQEVISDNIGVTWELTKEKLLSGFHQNSVERPHDVHLSLTADAFTRDSILQFALFGEIYFEV